MEYVKYNQLVSTHGVRLVEYPLDELTSPSNITSITALRQLRDALKTRTCKWDRMTPAEYKEHTEKMAERQDDVETTTGKTRKRRSDAGQPRTKRARTDAGKENKRPKTKTSSKEKPSKKSSKAPSKKGPSSREIISDDDDDDDALSRLDDDED